MRGDGRVLGIVGLKIFGESFAGEAAGFDAERIQGGAHAGGVAQLLVGSPENGGHALENHGETRAAFMAFDLRFFQVFEHAVDGDAEEGEFVLAGHFETRGKIAAGADLGDVLGEIGDARDDETLEQVESGGAEHEAGGDQQQQELHQAGVALLVNGSGKQNADDDRGAAVNIVQHLVGRERLAVERVDEARRTLGDRGGCGAEIGAERGRRKGLRVHGH